MSMFADDNVMTWVNTSGKQTITSAKAQIVGVAFVGTATGQIQFFAALTASASMSPIISFCATTSAVAGGFSPMFLRLPFIASGTGFTIDSGGNQDPNLMLFWKPLSSG